MFKYCKKRFKYKYIDKIKCNLIKSHYLSFGTTIHNTLSEYNNLPSQLQSYESLTSLLKKHWISEGYDSLENEKVHFVKAQDMLLDYFNDRKDSGAVILNEEMIYRNINKNLTICGKIDRVYVNEDNKIEVLDYKTANSFSPIIDIYNDVQLPIYSLLLKYKLDTFPKVISYYYLNFNNKVSIDLDKKVIDYCLLQLKKVISEIYYESEFPCNPSSRCSSFCEYFTHCEYFRKN